MPTYEYRCKKCGHEFEEFQSITAKPTRKCPQCGKNQVNRLISAGAGFIFKGSGFYQTDYRSEGYKEAAKKDSTPTTATTSDSAPAKTDGKSDTRSATKSESSSSSKDTGSSSAKPADSSGSGSIAGSGTSSSSSSNDSTRPAKPSAKAK